MYGVEQCDEILRTIDEVLTEVTGESPATARYGLVAATNIPVEAIAQATDGRSDPDGEVL